MPEIEEHTVVEDGVVMGYVRTDTGDKETFEICPVEYWVKLSKDEAEDLAIGAMHESGLVDWGY